MLPESFGAMQDKKKKHIYIYIYISNEYNQQGKAEPTTSHHWSFYKN
jgi:hypothetical protein